jgi:ligand-binding sensor domain-containing protein
MESNRISKPRIGLIASILSLLLAECNCLATESAPMQVPAFPTAIVSQVTTQDYPLPRMNSSFRFEHLGTEDGLSQSVVNVIIQDKMGFMWFGTEDGLNRYDGYEIKTFRPDPDVPNSLTDRWITSLCEDSQGYLWIGTRQGGLNRYDPVNGQFTHYKNDPENAYSLSSNNVSSILHDNQGNLWIGTNEGLNRLDLRSGRFHHYRANTYSKLSSDDISVLYQDSNDVIWVGTTDNGLNRYDGKTGTFKSYEYNPQTVVRGSPDETNSISNNNIRDVVEDHEGNLWIATANGLNVFDPQLEVFFQYHYLRENQFSISDNNILSLFVDRLDGLWVGTRNGLDYHIENSGLFLHHIHNQGDLNSLSNNTIVSLYEDKGGVLWIGTYGGGLNKFNRGQSKFTYYRSSSANPNSLSADAMLTRRALSGLAPTVVV